ncbi:MAG: type II secretion system protein [Pseudomonadota bacterium]
MRRISKAGIRRTERGYTYVSVLALIVVAALSAQTTVIPAESARIRDREAELLFRGDAYRRAIAAYWAAGGTEPRLPQRLQDLIADPRAPERRFLRQLYPDPVTGADWTLIQGADGGIAGVASRSTARPRRVQGFPEGLEAFATAERYADWRFAFDPNR